jgi:hypothetical protein
VFNFNDDRSGIFQKHYYVAYCSAMSKPHWLNGKFFEKSSCWVPKCGLFLKNLWIFLQNNDISKTIEELAKAILT